MVQDCDPAVEPGTPAPQIIPETLSSMCSLMNEPIIMTGLFREILLRHFADPAYIEAPSLRRLLWKPGTDSTILIESAHRWLPTQTELRPAVLIKRNTYTNQRLGIGDRQYGSPSGNIGNQHFVTFWVGSHTLFCIGATGAQAEYLGSEVQHELTQFGPLILDAMGLHRFQVTEIGAVGELAEARDHYVVPVTVGYAYQEKWVIRQQAPIIRRLSLSLLLEC